MELSVVRHLSREIEAGNGAWAMLVANEQLEKKHPLQRAFAFKTKQISKLSKPLALALSEGKTFKELAKKEQKEALKSRFGFVGRIEKKIVSNCSLIKRSLRILECREIVESRRDVDRRFIYAVNKKMIG